MRKSYLLPHSACCLALIIPSAVRAEVAENSAISAGDIVVTAQRRNENLQDIPSAISAVSGETLQKLGVKSINDLITTTPSLKIALPFGDGGVPEFSIRGVTIGSFNLNQSRPIAVYVDDSIRSLGALEIMPIYDVERVEVLKGPQGSLYGLNAVGGAVNIITQRPSFDTSGYLTLGYGNYDRREARGAAQTVLIDDVLAVRAAFTMIKSDGYVKNLLAGGKNAQNVDLFSGRVSLRLKPSSRFDATLVVSRTTSDNDGYSIYPIDIGAGYNPLLDFTRAGLGYYEERRAGKSFGKARQTSLNLRTTLDLEFAKVSTITSYDTGSWITRNADCHCEFNGADDTYGVKDIKQFFQEVRLQSNDRGPLRWLVGASYLRDTGFVLGQEYLRNDARYNPDPAGSPTNRAFNFGNEGIHRHSNAAVYGRLDFDVSDNLHVFGGARYQRDSVRFLNLHSYFQENTIYGVSAIVPENENLDQRLTAKKMSIETGIDLKPVDGLLVYASFKQGFRGPATNSQVFFSPDEARSAKPETINAYEVGFKWDVVPTLRINASAFRYDYKDQQYLGLVPNTYSYGLVNAGSSRINGAEFELRYSPVEEIVLTAAGTFLDPKYREFELNDIDRSGGQIALAPKTALNFGADFNIIDAWDGAFTIHADTSYQSRVYFDATSNPLIADPGHWLVNGRVSWRTDDRGWTVAVWAQNLFQKKYFSQAFDTTTYFGFIGGNRGIPRTFGADVTFNF